MLRNAVKTVPRPALRINQPTPRFISPSSPRYLSTYTLPSSSSSSQSSSRAFRYGAGASALALIGGASYLLTSPSSSSDDSPSILSAPSFNTLDPLSSLDPSALSRTTAHLTGQGLTDLCRQWLVFAISEQETLVRAGPWIMGKVEWTRDHVPVLGSVVWGLFAFVRPPFYPLSISPTREVLNDFRG
jgi:proline dehydrogenase